MSRFERSVYEDRTEVWDVERQLKARVLRRI